MYRISTIEYSKGKENIVIFKRKRQRAIEKIFFYRQKPILTQ